MSQLRNNPPESVSTFEHGQMYKTLYDDMTENGVLLQYHDRYALGELAVINCDMNELRADLRKNGESIEVQGDRNVVTKKNPARDALEKIRPHQIRLMKEFKMTPNSRKANTGVPESQGNKDDGWGDV